MVIGHRPAHGEHGGKKEESAPAAPRLALRCAVEGELPRHGELAHELAVGLPQRPAIGTVRFPGHRVGRVEPAKEGVEVSRVSRLQNALVGLGGQALEVSVRPIFVGVEGGEQARVRADHVMREAGLRNGEVAPVVIQDGGTVGVFQREQGEQIRLCPP